MLTPHTFLPKARLTLAFDHHGATLLPQKVWSLLLYYKQIVTPLLRCLVLAVMLEVPATSIAVFYYERSKYSNYTLTQRASNINVKFNSNNSQQRPSSTSLLCLQLSPHPKTVPFFTSWRFTLSETYSPSRMGGHCLGTIKSGRREELFSCPLPKRTLSVSPHALPPHHIFSLSVALSVCPVAASSQSTLSVCSHRTGSMGWEPTNITLFFLPSTAKIPHSYITAAVN